MGEVHVMGVSGEVRKMGISNTLTKVLLYVALCSTSQWVFAYECRSYVSGDLWAGKEVNLVGLDAAMTKCFGDFGEARFGLSYYANDEFLYQGMTASARARAGQAVSAYIGMGMLVGEAEKEVDASHDGVNNDGDQYIDEADETRTLYDANLFVYPEAGLEIFLGDFGIVVAAKKYYGVTFDGEMIYSIGIATHAP